MTLASVVIPAHNRSKSISAAIESVVAQTWSDLEVIIVDDGSTDDTVHVVEEWAGSDSRIHLVRLDQRRGAQAARNTGIWAARGEWIAFLDSDDQWLPESLELRLQQAIEKGRRVVHSECYILHPGATEPQLMGIPRVEGRAHRELLRRPGPVYPSLLVHKEALARIGYLDEGILSYEEWDAVISLSKHYEFGWVSTPTFIYDCRHEGTMSKNLLLGAVGYEQVITKHRWSILSQLGPKALATHYQRATNLYHAAGDGEKARRCRQKAVALWPFRPRAILRRLQRLLTPALSR